MELVFLLHEMSRDNAKFHATLSLFPSFKRYKSTSL